MSTHLNYHYLRYFWMVAREGGLRRASERLHVSQPTISAQVKALEDQLGEKLFRREGRGLAMTEAGRRVFEYAEQIFSLGDELVAASGREGSVRPLRLALGLTDALPKLVAWALMRPALTLEQPVRLVVSEASAADLLLQLAAHRLDVVLADEPAPSTPNLRAFNHELGACGVSFLASPRLAARLKGRLPRVLSGAPLLLPTYGTALRRKLDHWFQVEGVAPDVRAEFDDAALMKIAAADGLGIVPLPAIAEREAIQRYGLRRVGRTEDVRQQFFAISAERRLTHPAVTAITSAAREDLFRSGARRAR
ncbi:MAG: LysR family transcriptional regulator [Candidatus Eisenbacteria bacterium]